MEQQASGEGREQSAWLPVQKPGQQEGVTSRASPGSGFPLAGLPKEGTSPWLLEGAHVFSSSCLPPAVGPKICLSHSGLSLGCASW